ncbi:hypothetical protein PAXRUDRAFT_281792 [Paxillus rubicundulus Ve08.2h10]|uniref:Uncharacterized protein n=1 Tax=Paxillus rubicundulus Ve08.2h10 TaxID=930991 RepID=A0A0D0DEL0_9AGAM|nr:hypothetical protein PAXRUDRAFT_281792 [Paxillus rubicundulus Ve08.2h10]
MFQGKLHDSSQGYFPPPMLIRFPLSILAGSGNDTRSSWVPKSIELHPPVEDTVSSCLIHALHNLCPGL